MQTPGRWRLVSPRPGIWYVARTVYRAGQPTTEYLHRLIMERVLGRALGSRECVHHIDGRGLNNHPSNLLVLSPTEHQSVHHSHSGEVVLVGLTLEELRLIDSAARLCGQSIWGFSLGAAVTRASNVLKLAS